MSNRNNNLSNDLLEESKRLFDAAVAGTDAATLARLRTVRRAALEKARPRVWLPGPRLWLPAAAAAALLVLLVVPQRELTAPADAGNLPGVATLDLEILLGEEELEMLADFEFYEWLDMQGGDAADGGAEDGVG